MEKRRKEGNYLIPKRPNRGAISSVASLTLTRKEGNYRHLFDKEFRSKLEKGICFRCDERYYPGYKCRFKQFRMMIASVEEEEREETEAIEDGEVNLEEKKIE